MNHLYLPSESASSLILLFLGWGYPADVFTGLEKSGYDILLLSDFRNFRAADVEAYIFGELEKKARGGRRYEEVIVVGWSFGVRAAGMFLNETGLNVTLRLAINGTPYHIDELRGIPPEIFAGTLEGLSASTLKKFRLRCAGSKALYVSTFAAGDTVPAADIESLRQELIWFGELPRRGHESDIWSWDKAVIGGADRIFPPENQLRAWAGIDTFVISGMPHQPDFRQILDTYIIDKSKVSAKFSAASGSYRNNAAVQQRVGRRLYAMVRESLSGHESEFYERLIELGYGDGTFTELYYDDLGRQCGQIVLCDIKPGFRVVDDNRSVEYVTMDVESADFADRYLTSESADMIFSSSMFQWLNSPARMLGKCYNALRKGGMMALSFYGPGTVNEISQTIGSGLKYPSAQQMEAMARECGFSVDQITEDDEVLVFGTPAEALRHMQLTGVNALPGILNPGRARRLMKEWPVADNGKVTLTFHPVYMILLKN